jgi:hypothetical protein
MSGLQYAQWCTGATPPATNNQADPTFFANAQCQQIYMNHMSAMMNRWRWRASEWQRSALRSRQTEKAHECIEEQTDRKA